MFGPLTTEREKKFESSPFKRKVKAIPNQNESKSLEKGHVYIEYFDN